MRLALREMRRADDSERMHHPRPHFVCRQPQVQRTEGDVVEDPRHEELIVGVLEEQADAASQGCKGVAAEREAGDAHAACLRQQAAGEVQQGGRLAGAVGADDRQSLAITDLKRDPTQRAGAIGVGMAEIADFDDRARHHDIPPMARPIIGAGPTKRRQSSAAVQPIRKQRSVAPIRNGRSSRSSPSKPRHFIAR
ncbi:MAG: hypothetical protein AW07_03381 [Candidatus Accumulibacter sp. SK-11]|nr:MAG: hypothetical protein AW07_03381 [Candidatus Accumulibacter sp. SK-11]